MKFKPLDLVIRVTARVVDAVVTLVPPSKRSERKAARAEERAKKTAARDEADSRRFRDWEE